MRGFHWRLSCSGSALSIGRKVRATPQTASFSCSRVLQSVAQALCELCTRALIHPHYSTRHLRCVGRRTRGKMSSPTRSKVARYVQRTNHGEMAKTVHLAASIKAYCFRKQQAPLHCVFALRAQTSPQKTLT